MAQQDDSQIDEQLEEEVVEEQTASTANPLEERVKALEDQLKRAVADYQNLERRVAEGRSELTAWTTSEVLRKILPAVDHLEIALRGMSDEERKSGWAKGVQMAVAELQQVQLIS